MDTALRDYAYSKEDFPYLQAQREETSARFNAEKEKFKLHHDYDEKRSHEYVRSLRCLVRRLGRIASVMSALYNNAF